MIFFYGIRTKFIKAIEALNEVCANCNKAGFMSLQYYQRYFHVFWIPTIPLGKTCYSVCGNCKQTLDKSKMSVTLREKADREKSNVKAPLLYLLGPVIWAAIIGGFILIGYIGSYFNHKNVDKYVVDPKVNDVYVMEGNQGKYLPMKIKKVQGDKVIFLLGTYEYEKGSDAEDDDDVADYYSNDEDTYTKQELQNLNKSKQIYSIRRK